VDPLKRDEAVTQALAIVLAQFSERARESLLAFTLFTKNDYEINWHHAKLCEKLDDFANGKIKRLIVSMPPRHGKSELVSRRLPAFILGRLPNSQIIAASYGADLAARMNRDVQRIMESDHYADLFPKSTLNESNVRSAAQGTALRNSDIFEIVNHAGVYRSAGVGGAITGMGANFAIIDDPIKNQEEADSITYRDKVWDWYTSTLYTRLEKEGSVLLTMTRWHEDDLAGRLINLSKADPESDQWEVFEFPAIKDSEENPDDPRALDEALWPGKYDNKRLAKIKATAGSRVWNALYQQRPSALEGGIIKRSWIKFYRELPGRLNEQIQSWDATFKDTKKADFVCGTVWARWQADKYLITEVRGRMDIVSTIQAILTTSARYPKAYAKLVEDKANGPAIISLMKGKVPGLIPIEPEGSKEARLSAVAPDFEAGNVWFPHPDIAPWIHDFIEELVNFPNAKNDDRVDSLTQGLLRLQNAYKNEFSKEMIPDKIKSIASSLGRAEW
jgi:predicted phage terminase large subunit-like protein